MATMPIRIVVGERPDSVTTAAMPLVAPVMINLGIPRVQTAAIIAIFLPVAFMKGIIGRFFYEFGVTISVAVLLSLLEALTLTPMMCSRFVRPHEKEQHGRFYRATEAVFDGMLKAYDAGQPIRQLAYPTQVVRWGEDLAMVALAREHNRLEAALCFYPKEMNHRQLYVSFGFSSTVDYARERLGFE